ncbi:MAG: activase [Deltaproteobacteria bacterium]|nr:activase [Deltaproteobacteria bacterium]
MSATKASLGIDVGSTTLKLCLFKDSIEQCVMRPHEGDFVKTMNSLLTELNLVSGTKDILALVTGTSGRQRVRLPDIIAPVAIEAGLDALALHPRAVVSMGGEDLVVYIVDTNGHIIATYAGNKCASGTGEFFRQQLGRMNLTVDDLERVACEAKVYKISARCSVFMKSDCTHRLNKGEATKGDIALSLSKVMADKVSEFLLKARIDEGQVVLTGGVTGNRFLVQFLREEWPQIEFVVPKSAAYFEAFGAARLALTQGSLLPSFEAIIDQKQKLGFETLAPLAEHTEKVRYARSMRGKFDKDAEYILGIDGGSTTTKIALVRRDNLEIVASHYGRTHGDPVLALKECVYEVKKQIGDVSPRITLAATTGSSRELLGVFTETAGVYNEIIAHTVGTTYFEPKVDTIFEIGGQDAKYVLINNSVPLDYTMNEACSAGTGSFLEESAAGDLNIANAAEIGPIALKAKAPLKFGEHCSAFINSDIRNAISQGAAHADIVAGLVFSIVANYLNRVVQNRSVGKFIALQGGVAKNPAVPLAFAAMTNKEILVPADPEFMGCFGVARLAKQKAEEGLLAEGVFNFDVLLAKEIKVKNSFTCKGCDNYCEIKNLEVDTNKYPFGGRCSLYTNARKKRRLAHDAVDYTAMRTQMLFNEHTPKADEFVSRSDKIIGVPKVFSVHSLWPFYSSFFHNLGVRALLSECILPQGIARQESNYCFPAEIAHGATQDVLERSDYLFLPHFRDMPSLEGDRVHACTCPLTQGLPYMIRQAFAIDDQRVLRPVVSFKNGLLASRTAFEDMANRLGFSKAEGSAAYEKAIVAYEKFIADYRKRGAELLAEIQDNPEKLYVSLLGRPYNAFTRDANMGIPRKLISHGVTVVPFDMIYNPEDTILPNMYWYYGQQNMKTVRMVRRTPNLFLTWISNFSCAPDSFMLHYVRHLMGQKPYLVLEMDSHTADAGIDTRIEAFLDIVESYRKHVKPKDEISSARRYRIALKKSYCDVVDTKTGERIDIRDPRITLVWPSMSELGVQAIATASRKKGIKSVYLPIPDEHSTQLARAVASGKECIPALLVLGSSLKYFKENPPKPGEINLLFVPSTLGPCRTGQYHVYYDQVFEELGLENVVQIVAASENSYRELGNDINKDVWRSVVFADYFTDIRSGIRLLAKDPDAGMKIFDEVWQDVLQAFSQNTKELDRALKRACKRFSQIEKARTLEDVKKVLIVGEIYVRRDDFSVQEVTDFLIERGIFPKVTGTSEWFLYTDYARKYLMNERRKRVGFWGALGDGGIKEEAWFHVEAYWKKHVEHKVHMALAPTGFIPEAPQNMKAIIKRGSETFIDPALESEATVSSAVAAEGMRDGFSGVAVIAPFGCLPGRLIEGVYAPWAKARGYPVIALENDGRPYPPNTISRMEVFAHNVLRFEKSAATTLKND